MMVNLMKSCLHNVYHRRPAPSSSRVLNRTHAAALAVADSKSSSGKRPAQSAPAVVVSTFTFNMARISTEVLGTIFQFLDMQTLVLVSSGPIIMSNMLFVYSKAVIPVKTAALSISRIARRAGLHVSGLCLCLCLCRKV